MLIHYISTKEAVHLRVVSYAQSDWPILVERWAYMSGSFFVWLVLIKAYTLLGCIYYSFTYVNKNVKHYFVIS